MFNNINKLNQAMILFKKSPHIGQRVNRITLLRAQPLVTDHVLSIIKIFANIKNLYWWSYKNELNVDDNATKVANQRELSNWKYLECIVDKSYNLNISTNLLASYYPNLHQLEVSFSDTYVVNNRVIYGRSLLEALLKNISNAPHLNKIKTKDIAIELSGLEVLHTSLPGLKEFDLSYVYMNPNNDDEKIIVNKEAEQLESFSLHFCSNNGTGDEDDLNPNSYSRTIAKWISYIGEKYHNLHIAFGASSNLDHPNIGELAIAAIKNIKRLISYNALGIFSNLGDYGSKQHKFKKIDYTCRIQS